MKIFVVILKVLISDRHLLGFDLAIKAVLAVNNTNVTTLAVNVFG